MTAEAREAVKKMLITCSKAFPNCKADAETIALYVQLLSSLTVAEVRAALYKHMQVSRFFPTIAEIIAAAESVKLSATGRRLPDAGEAWKEAMDNVRKYGCYKPWQYSCPEVELACRRFGQQELIYLESSAVNTARAQFMRIYVSIVERSREDRQNGQVLAAMGPAASELADGTTKRISIAVS